ncbi:hypothetical protein [Chondromyces apiculatus]|uniref:Uncharacterized protein n=1 Tax=Chondromyces apiculatus DSM 436 TaxID=1192034 RepID=A0A017TDY1_9BACT|nr:hypothetical protein [Chondromyces apiculatus]EYF07102.1 Hypothetical protein CAP_0581 [Chondromyces apiculatus DSM 436]
MAKAAQPYVGPVTLDITSIGPRLKDLPPGALRGMRRAQPGLAEVLVELATNMSSLGAAAGIGPELQNELEQCNQTLEDIQAVKAVVDKWTEVLDESLAFYEHEREGTIGQIADAVKSSARRKDESLLAPFAKTVAYNAQVGLRAVKTRRRNAEAAAEAEDQASETKPTSPQA